MVAGPRAASGAKEEVLRVPSLRRTVWAFIRYRTSTPAADFCRPVRMDRSTLSPDSGTNGRSPEVSSTAFRTQPPDLQPVPLMDMGFAVICPLARHRMPQIRFLSIGSCVCSTLLSDPASRRRPCASLLLHLHQVVDGTFTPELSNMLGTQNVRHGRSPGGGLPRRRQSRTLGRCPGWLSTRLMRSRTGCSRATRRRYVVTRRDFLPRSQSFFSS